MSVRERESGTRAAFDLACRWLGRARRSEAEVRGRLQQIGFGDPTVEKALDRLRELHFVDDYELAQTRAQALAVRGYANAWIQHDLQQRGLPEEAVEEALSILAPEIDRARKWVERCSGDRGRKAAWRSLLRRGFGPEDAERALRAAGGGADEKGLAD